MKDVIIENPQQAIELMGKICDYFGWEIGFPKGVKEISGVIMGTTEFVDAHIEGYNKNKD